MARSHARIFTTIWSDADFVARSCNAQWLYFVILSQPTLSFAGVTPLTPRRWASFSSTITAAEVVDALAELAARRFVIVDDDTEEVMVRTFLRNDGLLASPNVAKAAVRDWHLIVSEMLRSAVVAEVPDGYRELFREPLPEGFREGFPEGFPEPLGEPQGKGSGNGSGKVLAGARGRARTKTPSPTPTPSPSPSPKHTPAPAVSETEPAGTGGASGAGVCIHNGFEQLWQTWPEGRRTRRADAAEAWTQAVAAGAAPAEILAGLEPWLGYWAGVEPRYVPRPDTWIAKGDWATRPPRSSRKPRKVDQALAVLDEVTRQETGR